jgi:hypothetical protein
MEHLKTVGTCCDGAFRTPLTKMLTSSFPVLVRSNGNPHHIEQCDKLEVGTTIALRNCKVVMHKNCMRLAIDKWGAIKPTTEVLQAESINTEKRMSEIVYQQIKS